MDDAQAGGREFTRLIRILDTLRGENGCPWDRKQDIRSIVNYFLEEVYEAVDALYEENAAAAAEELGDVLMEVVFLCRICKENGDFNISDVLAGINDKMERRHPHVFGSGKAKNSREVEDAWNRQKRMEKKRTSILQGIGGHTPALLASFQLGLRAAAVGFDWDNIAAVMTKVKEEAGELEQAVGSGDISAALEEIGDMFFVLANLARHLRINPEIALRLANNKFITRFKFIEDKLKAQGKELAAASFEEMDLLWEEAKKA